MTTHTNRDAYLVGEMRRHAAVVAQLVGRGRGELRNDVVARYALAHAVMMFIEAAGKLSADFERENPRIPLRGVRPIRREIAHPYDLGQVQVDDDRQWRFARDAIPKIAKHLKDAVFPTGE